jgi:hypothetical protein
MMKTNPILFDLCWGRRQPKPRRLKKTLSLQGLTFHSTSPNEGSTGALRLAVDGLKEKAAPIEKPIDGVVTDAEIEDLDANGFPEVYIYTQSAGSGSYGAVIGYASNRNISVGEITLPELSKRDVRGYQGHDKYRVDERYLVIRFPIYLKGDTNAKATGGLRQVQYRLRPGEAGWILRRVKALDFSPQG